MTTTQAASAETGHDLATRLIAKHGTDRYPQPTEQALKVAAEVGELADALLKHQTWHDDCTADVLYRSVRACSHVRKEYADAGLALYELGTKLGLDLMACMAEVVERETRTFTAASEPPPKCQSCGEPTRGARFCAECACWETPERATL